MLLLVVHLSFLLLKTLDNFHSRPNPALQLLDLIIEHEFELFKLLSLLAILVNLVLFVLNSTLSLL